MDSTTTSTATALPKGILSTTKKTGKRKTRANTRGQKSVRFEHEEPLTPGTIRGRRATWMLPPTALRRTQGRARSLVVSSSNAFGSRSPFNVVGPITRSLARTLNIRMLTIADFEDLTSASSALRSRMVPKKR